jgi:flagellar basal body-associated protein FliL
MSDTNDTKPKDASAPPAAKPKGGGAVAMILGMILPAILAGVGSFGAVRVAAAHPPPGHGEHGEASAHPEAKPPGATVALDPFLVSITDAKQRAHPMKLSVAVEFGPLVKEDSLKPFVPRIRDAILSHMRTLAFEDAVDAQHSDKLRDDLLEACKKAGAIGAERVLITDLVSQ